MNIRLAIINVTSWTAQCADAEHFYAHLILCENTNVSVDNIEEFNVKHLGEKIELRRPLTLELAIRLDKKDGYHTHQRAFMNSVNHAEFIKEYPNYCTTNRFDTFMEAVNAGINHCKELNIDCQIITLYDGKIHNNT